MPRMDFFDHRDIGFPRACMSLIDFIDAGQIAMGVTNYIQEGWGWRPASFILQPATEFLPDVLWVDGGDIALLLATGVRRVHQHIPNVMQSVMDPRYNRSGGELAAWVDIAASQTIAALDLYQRAAGKRVLFFGHSYGSGIVAGVRHYLAEAGRLDDYTMHTVGSPRTMRRDAWDAVSPSKMQHWQNIGDAVCFVMPNEVEAAQLGFLYSDAAKRRANELELRGSVRLIEVNGSLTTHDAPVPPPTHGVVDNILWWAFMLDKLTGPRHSKAAYMTAFDLAAAQYRLTHTDINADGGGSWESVEDLSFGGSWGDDAPMVNVAQEVTLLPGVSLVSSPPPVVGEIISRQQTGRARGRRKEVIVDGVVVGRDTRSGLRRRFRSKYNSLKRMFRKLQEKDHGSLMGVVGKWS